MPTLADLASQFGATLKGDGHKTVTGVSTLADATPDQLSFLANPLYLEDALSSKAAAIVVSNKDFDEHFSSLQGRQNYLVVPNPYVVYAKIAQLFDPSRDLNFTGSIHPTAIIEDGAVVDATAYIGPYCFVGKHAKIQAKVFLHSHVHVGQEALIGKSSIIYANVSIYARSCIGERAIVHSGAVIGSDGFGFAPDIHNNAIAWVKVPQLGKVVIGNDVEIGANTTVDRGAIGDTCIGDGCKIDNQVQIAHNVQIGEHTVIAGCVGIAGSTHLGKYCIVGGSANFAGHLKIADRTTVSGGTNITRSIDQPGQHFTSVYPMLEHRDWEKNAAILRGLDKIRHRIRELEQALKGLIDKKQKEDHE